MVAVGGNQPRVSSKLVSQKLSVGFLASRHVNRSPVPVLAFKIREGSSLLSNSHRAKEIFSDRRGQAARLNQRGSFPRGRKSVRVEISIRHAGLVFNSGSGATPGWENASRGQVSRFSGAMTRSKTQRALKPLVTYVHARCGRY